MLQMIISGISNTWGMYLLKPLARPNCFSQNITSPVCMLMGNEEESQFLDVLTKIFLNLLHFARQKKKLIAHYSLTTSVQLIETEQFSKVCWQFKNSLKLIVCFHLFFNFFHWSVSLFHIVFHELLVSLTKLAIRDPGKMEAQEALASPHPADHLDSTTPA